MQTGLIYDERMTEHVCLWDPSHNEKPERFTRILKRQDCLIFCSFLIMIPILLKNHVKSKKSLLGVRSLGFQTDVEGYLLAKLPDLN